MSQGVKASVEGRDSDEWMAVDLGKHHLWYRIFGMLRYLGVIISSTWFRHYNMCEKC